MSALPAAPAARTLAPGVVVVDGLLSPAECDDWRAFADGHGYEDAPITTAGGFKMRKDIRNNDRAMVDDKGRADLLWSRVAPFCFDVAGRRAVGLNERLRFYRYGAGQKFDWHHDGYYERPDGNERSFLTFMVYLNDGCRGGETRIQLTSTASAAQRIFEDGGDPVVDVVPSMGMGLLFLHQLLHTGAEVTAGTKYVVRSDVMYRMVNP